MTQSDSRQLLVTALQHHQARQYSHAETIYHQILEREPHHPDALNLLGLLRHQVGKYDEAIELIGKAISFAPGIAPYHMHLGNSRRAKNDLAGAAEAYRRACELDANLAPAHFAYGVALLRMGKANDALTPLIRASEL